MTSIHPDAAEQNRENIPNQRGGAEDLARYLNSMARDVRDAFQCILDYSYTNPEENPIEKYMLARAVIVGTNYIEQTYGGSDNPFHTLAALINFLKVIDEEGKLPSCANQYLRDLLDIGDETGIIRLPGVDFELDVFESGSQNDSPILSESYCIEEIKRMQKLAGL
jgi:hypothetical protein